MSLNLYYIYELHRTLFSFHYFLDSVAESDSAKCDRCYRSVVCMYVCGSSDDDDNDSEFRSDENKTGNDMI